MDNEKTKYQDTGRKEIVLSELYNRSYLMWRSRKLKQLDGVEDNRVKYEKFSDYKVRLKEILGNTLSVLYDKYGFDNDEIILKICKNSTLITNKKLYISNGHKNSDDYIVCNLNDIANINISKGILISTGTIALSSGKNIKFRNLHKIINKEYLKKIIDFNLSKGDLSELSNGEISKGKKRILPYTYLSSIPGFILGMATFYIYRMIFSINDPKISDTARDMSVINETSTTKTISVGQSVFLEIIMWFALYILPILIIGYVYFKIMDVFLRPPKSIMDKYYGNKKISTYYENWSMTISILTIICTITILIIIN